MFAVCATVFADDAKTDLQSILIQCDNWEDAQFQYAHLLREQDVKDASVGLVVQSTDETRVGGLDASIISQIADAAVSEMGDIFFDPDESCGEYSVPSNIAYNAVQNAILAALGQIGVAPIGGVCLREESTSKGDLL